MTDEDVARLIQLFLQARAGFEEEYARFQKGGAFSFDTINAIEVDLYHLKNLCQTFAKREGEGRRKPLEHRDLLDLVVSSIFHEMLHLKEFIYTIEKYRPRYRELLRVIPEDHPSAAERDFVKASRKIVEGAEAQLPTKAKEVAGLFQDAAWQFEESMKEFASHPAVIRTLFFNRELLDRAYAKGGHAAYYARVYPGGLAEGLVAVAQSFQDSGFADRAGQALLEALQSAERAEKGKRARELARAVQKRIPALEAAGAVDGGIKALRTKVAALLGPDGGRDAE